MTDRFGASAVRRFKVQWKEQAWPGDVLTYAATVAGVRREGDDRQRQCGFTRRLRAENFDDAAARNAAHAERDIESQRARGERVHLVSGAGVAQAHDRAFTKLFFYLAQRGRESFLTILVHGESSTKCGAIISYSAPNAHLICIEIAEISLVSASYPVVARYRLLYRRSVRRSYRSAPD